MPNPLLETDDLPLFDQLDPSQVEPAIDTVLADNRRTLVELLERTAHGTPDWDTLLAPLEAMDDRLSKVWSPVVHLNAVMNSEGWRKAYNACVPKLSVYATELGQNEALYQAYQALADSPSFEQLSAAKRRTVTNALRDFRLSGVALPTAQKARFKAIMQRLAELGAKFSENVLDATQAWRLNLTDSQRLAGLPASALGLLAQNAEAAGEAGWTVTLDFPSYIAVLTHAEDRTLREQVYTAYVTRASDQAGKSDFDNGPVMDEILALRHEAAGLVGFANYAEYQLATRMARSTDEVEAFLTDLAQRSRPAARAELDDVAAFARERDGVSDLQAWDVPYYSEKLRESRFAISQEVLRPYFPAPNVVDGLFQVVRRLFGVQVQPWADAPVWHPDVLAYRICDPDGSVRGRFYLDLYARPNKRAGAWMNGCISRRLTAQGVQLPAAYLVCNFAPPTGGKPAQLTHQDVTTLFHEFGHGVHHLLTRQDVAAVAGIHGVEWDAVELPSQFLENWCWEREVIDLISGHVDTGEPLPEPLFQRMQAARTFQSGLFMVRQLEFALFDFRLHRHYDPAAGARIEPTLAAVRDEVAVIIPPAWNRFANSFSHIFAGGYAAGYYSYKWAEVLSADAYSAFEEHGVFDEATGRAFLTEVLEQGGSRDALESFKAFRGREPRIDALLRHSGIAA